MKKTITLTFFFLVLFFYHIECLSAERKTKVQPRKQKEVSVNYENVGILIKKAEELYHKGDLNEALAILEKTREHSKNVLEFLSLIEEKDKESGSLSKDSKRMEAFLLRAKKINYLKEMYTSYLSKSSYLLGCINQRLMNFDTANRYLLEALKNSEFSDDPNSIYGRSFELLRKINGLEGEI